MSRPRKPFTVIPPGWKGALQGKFLRYAFLQEPRALTELATKSREGKMSRQEWAQKWGVAGTWIERWAEDTLTDWRQQPPDVDSGWVVYPGPRDGRAAEGFSFMIQNEIPTCRLALGVSVGGKLREGEAEDDWERFVKSLHEELDHALSVYRAKGLDSGLLQELAIGTDEELDLKLQVAAVHVFGRKSTREIAELSGVAREKSVVTRWLQQILALLELPRTRRGGTRRPQGAKNTLVLS